MFKKKLKIDLESIDNVGRLIHERETEGKTPQRAPFTSDITHWRGKACALLGLEWEAWREISDKYGKQR